MTDQTSASPTAGPDAIEADIEAQREQLAGTVDALAAKLDVKSRAKATAADLADRATDAQGRPRPPVLAAAAAALTALGALAWWRRRR